MADAQPEYLTPGQTFVGCILGEEADLTSFMADLQWGADTPLQIRVGRSRATQYGGDARLSVWTDRPIPFGRKHIMMRKLAFRCRSIVSHAWRERVRWCIIGACAICRLIKFTTLLLRNWLQNQSRVPLEVTGKSG